MKRDAFYLILFLIVSSAAITTYHRWSEARAEEAKAVAAAQATRNAK